MVGADHSEPDSSLRGVTKDMILWLVTDVYLKSLDCNGSLLARVADVVAEDAEMVIDLVSELVLEEKITLTFSSVFVNPYIKAFPDLPPDDQVTKLRVESSSGICLYPTREVIVASVNVSDYDDRPFTKRLLLGEPVLTPIYFDLQVLDRYYSDPRYSYRFHDFAGSICVNDTYYESSEMPDRDKTLLQTFGIGYDADDNRVVVVFLRYLSNLTPEHQRIWHAHIRNDECKMVYEYSRSSFEGRYPECMSTYQAVIECQKILNELSSILGKPSIFNHADGTRPQGFCLLLRPTLKGFLEFAHLFDKMLSDNINKEFFGNDIPLDEDVERRDGRVEVRHKGTLTLLDEWLHKIVRFPTEEPYAAIVEPLQEVRRLRQRPAHSLVTDEYDEKYIQQQDELVQRVCRALSGLCMLLSGHPMAKTASYTLPDWLLESKVKSY